MNSKAVEVLTERIRYLQGCAESRLKEAEQLHRSSSEAQTAAAKNLEEIARLREAITVLEGQQCEGVPKNEQH